MAAGRNGESEHRDGNSGNEVSRRKYSQSMCEYDGIKTGGTDDSRYRGHVQEITKVRVRRDINKGDMSRGYLYDSSGCNSGSRSGGGGSRQSELSGSAMDQEAGELSSDSGSDEAIQSVFKEDETLMPENGPAVPVETKKRKFSPIVWDRDDKKVTDLSVSATSTIVDTHPRRPPLSKSILKSSDHIPGTRKKNTPIAENNLQGSEIHKSSLGLVSESRVDIAALEPQQHHNGHREVCQLEEDDCISTRSISVSRWADASFSGKEGSNGETVDRSIISVSRWADASISGKEELKEDNVDRRKVTPKSESIGLGVRSKSLTPQLAELNREGAERNGGRPSEDEEGGYRGRSSSQSEHSANDLDTNNFMEIDDEEDYNDDTSLTQSCTESEDGKVSHGTPEPVVSPLRTVNMLKGCRSVEEFERLNKIDEGTYGVVYRAKDKKTGEIVALKKVKMEREKEGFPLTSLREINILLSVHHPSIVDVKEVVVGSNLDSIFMVMEYMEHDLKGLMEAMKQPFSQSEVKCLMLQLLKGIKYLHDNWVLHRDLKTSNLLFNNRGELKICDLGMARQYGSPLKQYTHLVVTLWYRAPELLLGAKLYSTAIDMWSLGCIMAELLSKAPLFNGKTEFDQLDKIFRILGTPNESIWPGFSKLPGVKVNFVNNRYNLLRKRFPGTPFTGSPVLSDSGFDLLSKLLTYDPEKRISAEDALNHPWFGEVPLPKSKEFMPTFPAQHAQDRRSRRIMKSPDPLEEQRLKELQQGQLGTGGLFG